jgi:hypothetical protein
MENEPPDGVETPFHKNARRGAEDAEKLSMISAFSARIYDGLTAANGRYGAEGGRFRPSPGFRQQTLTRLDASNRCGVQQGLPARAIGNNFTFDKNLTFYRTNRWIACQALGNLIVALIRFPRCVPKTDAALAARLSKI